MASRADAAALEAAVRRYALERTEHLANAFVELLRSLEPYRSGDLQRSTEVATIDETPNGYEARVVVGEPYGIFQNYGTGVYGPNGSPLLADALTAGWLTRRGTRVHRFVFDWPARGGLTFARTVRGTAAQHFWERAIQQWPDLVAAA